VTPVTIGARNPVVMLGGRCMPNSVLTQRNTAGQSATPPTQRAQIATASGARPRARTDRAARSRAVALAGVVCALLLVWGFRLRDDLYFSPDEPLGYRLGIFGTACMVLLLGYSLRKRMRALAHAGPVRSWFQVHMVLGLVGPTAILFHCNFAVGSVNSGVALACVLLVAGSGIVGRFLYPRIHHGLSGRRTTFAERRAELEASRGALAAAVGAAPDLAGELQRFESAALAPASGAARMWQLAALGARARRLRARAKRSLRRAGAAERRDVLREVRDYTRSVRELARFRAYERVFGLWHAVHLPLCVLLFVAAVVHVVAVNLY
jgi:hypothetical protein